MQNLRYSEFVKMPVSKINLNNPVHNRYWLMWLDGFRVDDDGRIRKIGNVDYKKSIKGHNKIYLKGKTMEEG